MKTKLSFLYYASFIIFFLALRPLPCALSQVPQGFNYQAIIRDGVTKQPITSQPVLIRVTIEDGIGTDLYQETHSISTDEFGIISIIVGQGTPWGTSDFDEIDWNDEPLSMKTEVQYPVGGSYTLMGTAPLMSVPYAMVADSLGGPLKNLKVKGSATTPDTEALFEVKNTTGQTVFAVYNEGVRIYVNDQDAKGPKGGFAIGGFGMGKTIPHEYLFISGDSVRFYIDNGDLDKGPKGGFAIGGFGTVKGLNQKYLTVSNDSVRIYVDNADTDKGPKGGFAIGGYGTAKGKPQDLLVVNNDSVRIYIDNQTTDKGVKGGFAIGGYGTEKGLPQKLLTVSNDSVRIYIDDAGKGPKGGFAIGGFDQAKGGNNANFFNVATSADDTISPSEPRILWYPLKNAFMAGQILILTPDSVGLNSVATGFESRAKGAQSQAMGYQAVARGNFSTAIGKNAFAGKDNSFAFGDGVSALRVYSYAFGKGSIARGDYSFALGNTATASGYSSYAFGENVTAGSSYSYAFGKGSSTGNSYAVAMGNEASATGFSSYSFGESSQATKQYSYAFGKGAKAQGDYSFSLGNTATASGNNSFALGESVTASFPNSYAFGKGSSATNDNAIAMGLNASASGSGSFAINGTASGLNSSAVRGSAQGEGSFSVSGSAIGNYSKSFGGTANGAYSMTSGSNATATGDYSIALGYRVATNGKYAVAIGSGNELPPYTTTYAGAEGAIALGSIARATGKNSTAIGNYPVASAENSVSIGTLSTASGTAAMALGSFLTAGSYFSTAVGYNNSSWGSATEYAATDPLFVIGNGFTGPESNAVTVLKNGRVGIGTGTGIPTHSLDVRGQMRITESGDYDVWIQGGSITGSGYTDNRNLALLGFDEDSGDKLFVNFLSEYAGGTEIGGPVMMPAVYSTSVTPTRVVYIQSDGKIGYNSSSIKYKENVSDILNSDWLYDLRPVTYYYKNTDPVEIQYGLIAEEVNEVNPLLVIYGSDKKPDGLMYEKLTVPMLKAIQDQKKEIESLRETISRLEALVEKLMEK